MLDQITPIILTYNEAPNIGRMLERLYWAREIVVVDSFSDDETLSIVKKFPQARLIQREFDHFADQLNFALKEGNIHSEWVLSLDADYWLPARFIHELETLNPSPETAGYRAGFRYCIAGHPLRKSIYPPVTVLFRQDRAFYQRDGHAHRVKVRGKVEDLQSPIFHDDRKPLGRWLAWQKVYAQAEAHKLRRAPWRALGWPDRIRKMGLVAPLGMFFYCLFGMALVLDGWRGIVYTLQRTYAELLLSFYLFVPSKKVP